MHVIDLNGSWRFKECGSEVSYPVTVPGSVLSGLIENDLIPDPFYGTNEYKTKELLRKNYEFSRSFTVPETEDNIELVMEGVDTVSTVYVNDAPVITTENMHRTYKVSLNGFINPGENEIRFIFISPITYIESRVPTPGKEITVVPVSGMAGNQYIRKAHSMFGWDWGPQLPDMGIWRNIYIRQIKGVWLEGIKVGQKLDLKKNRARLDITPVLSDFDGKDISYKDSGCKVVLTVKDPGGNVICENADVKKPVKIDDMKLWWVRGLGDQPLYEVSATLVKPGDDTFEGNTVTEKIGLRTFTVSRSRDEWGEELAFTINGVRFFSMGADYIPEDCIYPRITKGVRNRLLTAFEDANFNTVRIWGGGYYPSDDFYDLCDEKGFIVWQDFMFACNIYDLTDDFKENITAEIRDNVKRLRNHASLGLWCGNNEIETAFVNWGSFVSHSKALKQDYLTIFEKIIPSIVEAEDSQRFYWPSSPSSFGGFKDPDNDNFGDRHYWDVWHGMKPFTDYENHFFRFCSEFGFQSFPEIASVRKFASEGDMNIFSEVMESHQKNGSANAKILQYISENFLYPKNFESLIYVSQLLQGMAIEYGVDHLRRNRGRCMGALYWQANDNWPVASWASIDYYGRYKALHYMAKHFFKQVSGSVKRDGYIFTPYVSNESLNADDAVVRIYVKDTSNNILKSAEISLHTDPMSVSSGDSFDISEIVAGKERNTYVETVFTHTDGSVSTRVEPVTLYKYMKLEKPDVVLSGTEITGDTVTVTLSSNVFCPFTALMCDEANIVWEDNYFFLTDRDVKTVRGKIIDKKADTLYIRVMTLYDSYES